MGWQDNIEREMDDLGLDSDIRELERALATSLDKEESAGIIRRLLVEAGTNVEQNDGDPCGDGTKRHYWERNSKARDRFCAMCLLRVATYIST